MNNFDPLYKQIAEQIGRQTATNQNLNPRFNPISIAQFQATNNGPSSANNASYQWSVRASKSVVSNPGLLDHNIFTDLGIAQDSYSIDSSRGNLTVSNLDTDKIYSFSAIIQRYVSNTATSLNLPWAGSISIILNGSSIYSTVANTNGNLPIQLSIGSNTLEIIIYTSLNNNYFTINSDLANFADKWTIPSNTQSALVPQNIIVISDPNQSSANTFINKLTWDQNSDGTTYGYRVYRRGPYNYSINSPFAMSGNFTNSGSLAENSTYNYMISSYGTNGESLPLTSLTVSTYTIDPQFPSLNTLPYASPGGLGTGYYYYGLSLWGYKGSNKETTIVSINSGIFNPNTSSIVYWTLSSGVLSGNYGWTYPSGYKLYRSTSGVFSSNSLLAIITGIDTNFYIDLGNQTSSGQPQSVSNVFSGVGINLGWSFPQNTSLISGYYIYRSNSTQFIQNTLIATITNPQQNTFFDSGYVSTSGVPTLYRILSDIAYPTNRYDDIGVKRNQQYDYSTSSFNNLLIESALSTGVSIVVGNTIAPAIPSGIFVTSSDAYSTITWQNGNEPDLAGTKVYYSTGVTGPFSQVGDTKSTTFTQYIGYNSTAYFELANYNLSNVISSLSTGVVGSTNSKPVSSLSGLSIPQSYSWNISFSKNPTNVAFETISIVSPTPVQGTPIITVQQNGQSSASSVIPVNGSSPNFSGIYTVTSGFDGQAIVIASGTAVNSGTILGSAILNVDTLAPQNPIILINEGAQYSKAKTNTIHLYTIPQDSTVSKMYLNTLDSITTSGTYANYKFENNALDSSVYGYNASIVGTVPFQSSIVDQGSFSIGPFPSGQSHLGFVNLPSNLNAALDGMVDFEISFDAYILDVSSNVNPLYFYESSDGSLIYFGLENNALHVRVTNNQQIFDRQLVVAKNQWNTFRLKQTSFPFSLSFYYPTGQVETVTDQSYKYIFKNSGVIHTIGVASGHFAGNSNYVSLSGYIDDFTISGVYPALSTGVPYNAYSSWTYSNDGLNYIYGAMEDSAGNRSITAHNTITIDTVAPLISGTTPNDGSLLSSNTNLISGWAFDSTSQIDPSSLNITVDGTNYTSSLTKFSVAANTTGFYINPSPNLTDGQHQVSITVSDFAGNTTHKDYGFTTLATIPSTPTNLAAIGLYNGVALFWDKVTDRNLNYYEIQVSGFPLSTGWNNLVSWSDTNPQYSIQSGVTIAKTNFFTHSNLEGNVAQKSGVGLCYRIRAVNTVLSSGNFSNIASGTSTIVNSGDIAANSIYANKIVAGEIYSKLLQTQEFRADAISAGTINANLVTVAGGNGSNVTINATGITIQSGALLVKDSSGNTAIAGNTITTSNINISNMAVLTTTDIDAEYYFGMEQFFPGTYPQSLRVHSRDATDSGGVTDNVITYMNYNPSSNTYGELYVQAVFNNGAQQHRLDISGIAFNNINHYDAAPITVSQSGFPSFKMNVVFYSGSNMYLHNYQKNQTFFPGGHDIFFRASILSGIGFSGFLASSSPSASSLPWNPKIAYNTNFPDNQVISYVTGIKGTNGGLHAQYQLGFVCVDQNGYQTGIPFYDQTTSLNYNGFNMGMDCCMDSNGNTHVFNMVSPGGAQAFTSGIQWIKYNINPTNSSIIKTGILFPNNYDSKFTYEWLNLACGYDSNENVIHLFASNNQYDIDFFIGETIFYGKIDTNGNIICNLTPVHYLPFDPNTFDFAYNSNLNFGYSIYNVGETTSSQKYLPGIYRRRHLKKVFPVSSMYQILQSIMK